MIISIVLIILGTIFQSVVMFRTGMLGRIGIPYFGPLARDGVWHEALVGQLLKNIPPINPGFSEMSLTNYHYYYDLLVSLVVRLGIPANFLIYGFFPLIFSILLGVGTYKLSLILFKEKKVAILSVFFAYFASSFGWIVDLVKGKEIGGESAFWANQPVSMNINPPFAISLVIIIFTIIVIHSFINKSNFVKGLIIVLLSGTLIGFKVYAGAILLGGLFVLGFKRALFEKDFKIIGVSFISLIISLLIILPQSKSSLGLIEFKPLWLVDTMIDAGDRVGIPNFTARRFAYQAENKYLHLFAVELIGLFIFLIGNLGTRIIGVFGIEKKQIKNDLFILIFAMMLASLIPPLIFIQKGNAWNIVQFFYYFLYFSGIFAAYSLRRASVALTIIVLLITPISSIATFRSWLYPNPPAYLSKTEYEGLKYLSTQSDGVVLKYPFNSDLRGKFKDPFPLAVYADNAYVSAHSGKSVFIEDVEQQIVLNTDYKGRVIDANRFFSEKDLSWSEKFLKDNNITYVYLPKIYQLPMAEAEYPMKKIFENDDANIYKVE